MPTAFHTHVACAPDYTHPNVRMSGCPDIDVYLSYLPRTMVCLCFGLSVLSTGRRKDDQTPSVCPCFLPSVWSGRPFSDRPRAHGRPEKGLTDSLRALHLWLRLAVLRFVCPWSPSSGSVRDGLAFLSPAGNACIAGRRKDGQTLCLTFAARIGLAVLFASKNSRVEEHSGVRALHPDLQNSRCPDIRTSTPVCACHGLAVLSPAGYVCIAGRRKDGQTDATPPVSTERMTHTKRRTQRTQTKNVVKRRPR